MTCKQQIGFYILMLMLDLQILGASDRAFALQGEAHAYSRPLLFGWAILYAAICLVIYRSVEKRVKAAIR